MLPRNAQRPPHKNFPSFFFPFSYLIYTADKSLEQNHGITCYHGKFMSVAYSTFHLTCGIDRNLYNLSWTAE